VLVTRIAPTPSGFLHPGNAVNMLLTAWLARQASGRLLLRIDDFDTGRARHEYLVDVFDTLEWLGIHPDEGPQGPGDFLSTWSMATRIDQFRAARDLLRTRHPDRVFTCACSRRHLDGSGRCVARCRDRRLDLEGGTTVLRLAVDAGSTSIVAGREVAVPAGDHVLWRRDDLPAYQLGSVVADEALEVTAIVRGVDLLPSSALQRHLATLLAADGFARADLRHHGLLAASDGSKLSKSAGAQAHPMDRGAGLRTRITRWARELGWPLGIGPP
jgi:glutamyl-tRNA synthetase